MTEARSKLVVIWFSRILRWALGLLFITIGIRYYNDGAWPAIVMGIVLVVTGFLKPRRCMDDTCQR